MDDERDLPIESDPDYALAQFLWKGRDIAGDGTTLNAMRLMGIREEVVAAILVESGDAGNATRAAGEGGG